MSKRIEAVERKIETRVGGGDGDGKAVAALAAAAREETRAESETRRAATSARERAEAADARRRRAAARLRDTLASLGDGASPLATLERARAETERARVETSETLPDVLREKRRRERALIEASDARNFDETELRERAGEVNVLTASVEEDERFIERKERERDGGDPAARQQASLAKSVRAKRDAAASARDALAARARRAEEEREALLQSSGEETNEHRSERDGGDQNIDQNFLTCDLTNEAMRSGIYHFYCTNLPDFRHFVDKYWFVCKVSTSLLILKFLIKNCFPLPTNPSFIILF